MATGASLAYVRAWAREQGIKVGDRGRLPAGLVEQYEAAHAPTGKKTGKTPTAKPVATAPVNKAPEARIAKPVARRAPARAAVSRPEPDVQVPPHLPAAPAPVDETRKELELVRSEVTELRKQLTGVLARLTELEQPRGLFNRPKAKR